jgi:hypothetical protein
LPADHRAQGRGWQTGHRTQHGHGCTQGAERHGRGVEDQHEHQRLDRGKAHHDQQGTGDRNRRAEAGDALDQGAETKSDHDEYDPPIVRQIADDPTSKGIGASRSHRDVVEKQSVDDDPHHGPQSEDGAVRHGRHGEAHRHVPGAHGDTHAESQADERRLPGGPAQNAEQDQYGENGQGCDERR